MSGSWAEQYEKMKRERLEKEKNKYNSNLVSNSSSVPKEVKSISPNSDNPPMTKSFPSPEKVKKEMTHSSS